MATAARSSIEVFFKVAGDDKVASALKRVALAGDNVAGKMTGAASGITRAFGTTIVRAIRGALGAVSSLALAGPRALSGMVSLLGTATARFGLMSAAATAAGYSIYRLGTGILSITQSNAELTSTVLGLRAINGEIQKASGLPLFRANKDGSLFDANANGGSKRKVTFDEFGNAFAKADGGGTAKTARDLAYLNKTADAAGISIKSLAKDYIGLVASTTRSNLSLQETQGIFTGVTNAGVALGLTVDQTHRAFVALQQIASKGQVYAEELKGQLAEAIPGIIPLVADAYGLSVKELNKQIADGMVDSVGFFQRVGKALNEQYAGAAQQAAKTTRVALGQLSNAFFNAKVAIGSGALDKEVARIVRAITEIFRKLNAGGFLTKFGEGLADAIAPVTNFFEQGAKDVTPFVAILNFAVRALKAVVNGIFIADYAFRTIGLAFRTIRGEFERFGVKLPSVGQVILKFIDFFQELFYVIGERRFSDNPFANFLASIVVLAEAVIYAITKAFGKDLKNAATSGMTLFDRLARVINQAAAALISLSNGTADAALNEQGVRFVRTFVNIKLAVLDGIAKAKAFYAFISLTFENLTEYLRSITDIYVPRVERALERVAAAIKKSLGITDVSAAWKDFLVLISGQDASKAADTQLDHLFTYRKRLGELLRGDESQGLFGEDKLRPLFQIRDTFLNIIEILIANIPTILGFAEGLLTGIRTMVAIFSGFSAILSPIAKLMGFSGINEAIGYGIGLFLVFNRIKGLIIAIGALLRGPAILGAIVAVYNTIGALGATLGAGAAAGVAGVGTAAAGAVAFGAGASIIVALILIANLIYSLVTQTQAWLDNLNAIVSTLNGAEVAARRVFREQFDAVDDPERRKVVDEAFDRIGVETTKQQKELFDYLTQKLGPSQAQKDIDNRKAAEARGEKYVNPDDPKAVIEAARKAVDEFERGPKDGTAAKIDTESLANLPAEIRDAIKSVRDGTTPEAANDNATITRDLRAAVDAANRTSRDQANVAPPDQPVQQVDARSAVEAMANALADDNERRGRTTSTLGPEELRGVLAEIAPNIANISAEAYGVSQDELNRMLDAGQIQQRDLLEKVAEYIKANPGVDLGKVGAAVGPEGQPVDSTAVLLAAQKAANDLSTQTIQQLQQEVAQLKVQQGEGFTQPVYITLPNGEQVAARTRPSQNDALRQLASDTARSRTGTMPWDQ